MQHATGGVRTCNMQQVACSILATDNTQQCSVARSGRQRPCPTMQPVDWRYIHHATYNMWHTPYSEQRTYRQHDIHLWHATHARQHIYTYNPCNKQQSALHPGESRGRRRLQPVQPAHGAVHHRALHIRVWAIRRAQQPCRVLEPQNVGNDAACGMQHTAYNIPRSSEPPNSRAVEVHAALQLGRQMSTLGTAECA